MRTDHPINHFAQLSQLPPHQADFGVIYSLYYKKIYKYFLYHTGHDIELTKDLTEETFFRALEHFSKFKDQGYSYVAYLMTIAHNLLANYYRKSKSVPWSKLSLGEIGTEENDNSDTFDTMELFLERKDLVRAIEHLTPLEHALIDMKYVLGLPITDIATRIHHTPNATKLLLFRMRNKIRRECGVIEKSKRA